MNDVCLVLTALDDLNLAQSLAREIVELRMAACVNVFERVHSVYRWKGQVESTDEVLLVVKTATDRVDGLKEWLNSRHPYDLPEFLVLAASGSSEYLAWVLDGSRPG